MQAVADALILGPRLRPVARWKALLLLYNIDISSLYEAWDAEEPWPGLNIPFEKCVFTEQNINLTLTFYNVLFFF